MPCFTCQTENESRLLGLALHHVKFTVTRMLNSIRNQQGLYNFVTYCLMYASNMMDMSHTISSALSQQLVCATLLLECHVFAREKKRKRYILKVVFAGSKNLIGQALYRYKSVEFIILSFSQADSRNLSLIICTELVLQPGTFCSEKIDLQVRKSC